MLSTIFFLFWLALNIKEIIKYFIEVSKIEKRDLIEETRINNSVSNYINQKTFED